ncbi:hypothetical protein P3S68_022997 [Capsicum galapagoense]
MYNSGGRLKFSMAESEKDLGSNKKLKVDDENNKEDLKVNDDGKLDHDSDDWETWPNKDVFIKYYQQLHESDKKERYVKEIVKINGGGPRDFNYYITFKIDNEGKEETFQAQVVSTIRLSAQ